VAEQPLQQEEERRLREFFAGDDEGVFVEVGVHRPGGYSPTRPFEQAGWDGVLIEPQPELAAFLVTARTAKLFAVACAAPENAGRTLALRVAGADGGGYLVSVPTRTLDDILREAEAVPPIDLLALDVAGREVEVLRGFDFLRWQPRLILIEDPARSWRLRRFLRGHGYRLIRLLGDGGWYVPDDAPARAGRAERWDIVRAYYLGLPARLVGNVWRRYRQLFADWRAGR
jgi:FkbM family methyltransferase